MSTVTAVAKDRTMTQTISGQYLANATFVRRNYPVWTSWNGMINSNGLFANIGSFGKGIAAWSHYSPIFNQGWSSYVGNQFLKQTTYRNTDSTVTGGSRMNSPDGNQLLGFDASVQHRIIKLFGAGNLYKTGFGGQLNNNLTRSNNLTGAYAGSAGSPRLVSNTTNTSSGVLNGNSNTLNYHFHWSRHEWRQVVSIPNSSTGVKVTAMVKIAPDDKLKQYNWCGIYCTEDSYDAPSLGTGSRVVNYVGIKKSTDTYTRKTGTLTGLDAQYNWNGLQTTNPASGTNFYYFTPTTTYVIEHDMLDEDDFEDFRKIEFSFQLVSGTNRKFGISLFFAESIGNMNAASGDPTGGFQVFDPTVEFS